jgi:ribosomal protein S18 acetylase RimI-like enzyme
VSVRLRPWNGWTDLEGMRAVLSEGLRGAPLGSFAHPGDLSWWLGWPPKDDATLGSVVRIWESAGAIAGWAMLDEGDLAEYVRPAVGARERAAFFTAVDGWTAELGDAVTTRYAVDDDVADAERLRAAGWLGRSDAGLWNFEIDLAAVVPDPDPRVRPVERDTDLRGRLAITHAAFRVTGPFERYVEEYRDFMASPAYPSGWDLVVWDGDRAAACTIAWPDPASAVGNFEPVATDPELVRRGFGRAVVREGLRRLRVAGMERAIVRTPVDNVGAAAFYRSIGFRPTSILRGFARAEAPDSDG